MSRQRQSTQSDMTNPGAIGMDGASGAEGLILGAVGTETLENIVTDFLELLGTSCAVYEKDGTYAFGRLVSGWCEQLVKAATAGCGACGPDRSDEVSAPLYHDLCWSDCARRCVEEGEPVDVECRGRLRLYGVPITVHGEVAGAIAIGYGDAAVGRENPRGDCRDVRRSRRGPRCPQQRPEPSQRDDHRDRPPPAAAVGHADREDGRVAPDRAATQ